MPPPTTASFTVPPSLPAQVRARGVVIANDGRIVTALAPQDRCHLNGLSVAPDANGKLEPRYVTALAATDTPQGRARISHRLSAEPGRRRAVAPSNACAA